MQDNPPLSLRPRRELRTRNGVGARTNRWRRRIERRELCKPADHELREQLRQPAATERVPYAKRDQHEEHCAERAVAQPAPNDARDLEDTRLHSQQDGPASSCLQLVLPVRNLLEFVLQATVDTCQTTGWTIHCDSSVPRT